MGSKIDIISVMKEFLKSIKEYIPVLYLCLVCIGFIEKGLFYRQFQIDILDYLGIQEMLFMFVPIGAFIITLAFYIILAIVPIYILLDNEDNLDSNEKEEIKQKFFVEKSKTKKILRKVTVIYLILAPLFLFFYLGIVLFNRYIGISLPIRPLVIFIPMLLYSLLLPMMVIFIRKDKSDKSIRKMFIGMLISLLVIFSISILSRIGRANSILQGNPEYSISFEIKGEAKPIETNEYLVYIGQTSNNIFLRNLKTNSTEIFFKKDLNRITLRKIIND
ncbi:MAG: hypothetical protein ACTHOM_05170 [Allomuricauda sp.]